MKRVIGILSVLFLFPLTAWAEVPDSAQAINPIKIGQEVPDLTLTAFDGEPFNLHEAFEQKPTVLIFYRGGWCPYCNTHLEKLRTIEDQLTGMGFQILAISPDLPKHLAKTKDHNSLKYTLLSDAKMTAAKAMGLAFKVDKETYQLYVDYGIDLEESSGETHHMLPVPAAFIVNKHGKITFSFVAPDYKVRVNPSVILAAAQALVDSNKPKLN